MAGKIKHPDLGVGGHTEAVYEHEHYHLVGGVADKEVLTTTDVELGADVTDATNVDAAGAVMETDYDANTILAANADNTPLPLTVAVQSVVGRAAGNIDDIAVAASQIVGRTAASDLKGMTVAEVNTLLGTAALVSDAAYGAGWDGVTATAPSKNAVYDEIEALVAGVGIVEDDAYGPGWNGDTTHAPSQNAVYDKIELVMAGGNRQQFATKFVCLNTSSAAEQAGADAICTGDTAANTLAVNAVCLAAGVGSVQFTDGTFAFDNTLNVHTAKCSGKGVHRTTITVTGAITCEWVTTGIGDPGMNATYVGSLNDMTIDVGGNTFAGNLFSLAATQASLNNSIITKAEGFHIIFLQNDCYTGVGFNLSAITTGTRSVLITYCNFGPIHAWDFEYGIKVYAEETAGFSSFISSNHIYVGNIAQCCHPFYMEGHITNAVTEVAGSCSGNQVYGVIVDPADRDSTCTVGTNAGTLVDSAGDFRATDVGKKIYNKTDATDTTISGYVSITEVTTTDDIFDNGETYKYSHTFNGIDLVGHCQFNDFYGCACWDWDMTEDDYMVSITPVIAGPSNDIGPMENKLRGFMYYSVNTGAYIQDTSGPLGNNTFNGRNANGEIVLVNNTVSAVAAGEQVILGAHDVSGKRTLALSLEATVTTAACVADTWLPVEINGVAYQLPLKVI